MTNIASKNLFDLLGNDPDLDPDREPEPPTKAIDKPTQRAGKRNAGAEGPAAGASRARGGARGGRQDAHTGSEQAFRDRDAGRFSNRSKPADDSSGFGRGRGRGGGGGGRGGGRGGRGGTPRDDRHSRTGIADHEKQAAHGWGGQTGGDEWADERAGEAIAKEEEKAGFDTNVGPPVNADGEEFKPDVSGEGANDAWAPDEDAKEPEEDKTKSYAAYLAEQTEKKLSLGLGELEARKPNEGRDKKFPSGKALARDDNEENYMAGSGGKAARTREKKEKTRVQLDDERLLKAPELGGGRGGRGRGRGDSFRGDGGRGSGRGGRGDRGGGDRGGSRGFGGGERGRGRGGRGGGNVNVNDQSAFPSLGS